MNRKVALYKKICFAATQVMFLPLGKPETLNLFIFGPMTLVQQRARNVEVVQSLLIG